MFISSKIILCAVWCRDHNIFGIIAFKILQCLFFLANFDSGCITNVWGGCTDTYTGDVFAHSLFIIKKSNHNLWFQYISFV